MSFKSKIIRVPFLIAVGAIVTVIYSNYTILIPPQDTIQTPQPTQIYEKPNNIGFTHKNCLIKCPSGSLHTNILIDHDVILLSSNPKTKFADWVAYKSTIDYIQGPERKRNWAKDPKIDLNFTFTPLDYKGMSQEPYYFDRGHQAPLASFKSHPKWFVLNYLSNITPQKKDLNRGPWKALESAERKLVLKHGQANVLTGTYYDKKNLIQGPTINRITYMVPSGYWKIIAVKQGNDIKTVSFSFPQNTPAKENYCKYLVPVSQIERSTGLKFFNGALPTKGQGLIREIGCIRTQTTKLKYG